RLRIAVAVAAEHAGWAHPSPAGSGGAAGARPDEPADRPGADNHRANRRDARLQDPEQAQSESTRAADGVGRRARPRAAARWLRIKNKRGLSAGFAAVVSALRRARSTRQHAPPLRAWK